MVDLEVSEYEYDPEWERYWEIVDIAHKKQMEDPNSFMNWGMFVEINVPDDLPPEPSHEPRRKQFVQFAAQWKEVVARVRAHEKENIRNGHGLGWHGSLADLDSLLKFWHFDGDAEHCMWLAFEFGRLLERVGLRRSGEEAVRKHDLAVEELKKRHARQRKDSDILKRAAREDLRILLKDGMAITKARNKLVASGKYGSLRTVLRLTKGVTSE